MKLAQREARDLLVRAGGDRFAMFDLTNDAGTPIYVHAKVCIVDDTWMTCGSDNLNLRSWTHDSEITCAVVDPEGSLARDLRRSLWAEHLGLSPGDERLLDAAGSTALWAERVGAPGSRVRPHELPRFGRATRLWAGPAYRTFFDPDGRPRRMRGTREF
jgi:phosphatidylserine/phosphatidylglycerophosphate/cardiolipin synthase-like enzyme